MQPLFLYGTLRHAPLLAAVSGASDLVAERATLEGHAIVHAVNREGAVQAFPLFVRREGARAEGLVIRPGDAARARLDAYERAFGYDVTTIKVQTDAGPLEASIYLPQAALWQAGADWSLARWARDWGELTVETAQEVMALLPDAAPGSVLAYYPMLERRVASRRRARANPAPATLRRTPMPEDVQIEARATPYAAFFGVEEAQLRFRRFDATMSEPVRRAGFIMGDSVTVLPYDPRRDRVMVVEQFRFGPLVRGDRNPWSLEPVAGRIDPLETPEEAARRETREEAGLELGALLAVGRCYLSPGAVSEYQFCYVGVSDLGFERAGVSGLANEDEDIRAHVITFDRLMALVESGEVENAPLLLSAHWLARHREGLRAELR